MWVVHQERAKVKKVWQDVWYLKKDKVIYGTCLNEALAKALCDKYNRDEPIKLGWPPNDKT